MGIEAAQVLDAGSRVLSAALGGGGQPAPAISSVSAYSTVDHSNFNVATGSAKLSVAGSGFPWYAYAIAGLAVVMWMKKHK